MRSIVNATEEDMIEALGEPTVGHTLLEKLVLLIIDAHQDKDGRTRQNRLSDAMFALRGDYHARGQKVVDDRRPLLWMAVQRCRKLVCLGSLKIGPFLFGEDEPTVEHETIFSLAMAAVAQFNLAHVMSDKRSVARRLARKFEADSERLMNEAMYLSATPHHIEHQFLLDIVRKLHLCDVKCELPREPKAFF